MSFPSRSARRTLSNSFASLSALVIISTSIAACSLGGDVDALFQESSGGNSTGSAGTGGTSGTGGTTSTGTSSTGTSSTGTGSTGSNTTNSSSSSTGTSGGPEDCLDGIDNDGNGLIDCADPACQPGFECVESAPSGWDYFTLEKTIFPNPNPTVPSCANGATPETYFTEPAGPAQCSACTCGAPSGVTCGPPAITCYPGSQGCNGGGQNWTATLANGMCAKPNLGFFTTSLSCRLSGPPVVNGGSCQASTTDFANKDTWGGELVACAANAGGGGCSTGQACVQKPTDPAKESVCIAIQGQETCPSGWTSTTMGYTKGTDNRSCTACSCDPGGISCMGGSYTVYDLDQCATQGASDLPIPITSNMCTNVSVLLDGGSWSIKANLPTPSGGCTPSGGDPAGEVQTDGPITFCCK